MSFEEIKIVRSWPVINGYVQIPPNLPRDKTRLKAVDTVGNIPGGSLVQYAKSSKQGTQSFLTLQPLSPGEWYPVDPVILADSWARSSLALLNTYHADITALVPNMYGFWDDSTFVDGSPSYRGINDGGDDMYDGGNYLNTNRTNVYDTIKESNVDDSGPLAMASIRYTHTVTLDEDDNNEYLNPPMDGVVTDGTDYFGPGSEYFTNMYPGLFMLVADNIDITEFSIGGNIGADGSGNIDTDLLQLTGDWVLSFKAAHEDGEGDPSINQMILIPGSLSGITQQYDSTAEDDDHGVFGLAGRKRLIYALVATKPGEVKLTSSEAQAVALKILSILPGT